MRSPDDARQLATALLSHRLSELLQHVLATAKRVNTLRHLPSQLELTATSATLHDIGYAPDLADIGFHPIDGARFLRSGGWDETIVNLVAHHSCASIEAEQRRGTRDRLWTAGHGSLV